MISSPSGALSTAQAVTDQAGLLTFAQYCTVYDGTSTGGKMLVQCSTAESVSLQSPIPFGSGLFVTITSSGTAPGIVHFK